MEPSEGKMLFMEHDSIFIKRVRDHLSCAYNKAQPIGEHELIDICALFERLDFQSWISLDSDVIIPRIYSSPLMGLSGRRFGSSIIVSSTYSSGSLLSFYQYSRSGLMPIFAWASLVATVLDKLIDYNHGDKLPFIVAKSVKLLMSLSLTPSGYGRTTDFSDMESQRSRIELGMMMNSGDFQEVNEHFFLYFVSGHEVGHVLFRNACSLRDDFTSFIGQYGGDAGIGMLEVEHFKKFRTKEVSGLQEEAFCDAVGLLFFTKAVLKTIPSEAKHVVVLNAINLYYSWTLSEILFRMIAFNAVHNHGTARFNFSSAFLAEAIYRACVFLDFVAYSVKNNLTLNVDELESVKELLEKKVLFVKGLLVNLYDLLIPVSYIYMRDHVAGPPETRRRMANNQIQKIAEHLASGSILQLNIAELNSLHLDAEAAAFAKAFLRLAVWFRDWKSGAENIDEVALSLKETHQVELKLDSFKESSWSSITARELSSLPIVLCSYLNQLKNYSNSPKEWQEEQQERLDGTSKVVEKFILGVDNFKTQYLLKQKKSWLSKQDRSQVKLRRKRKRPKKPKKYHRTKKKKRRR